jgi:hypothetical protein
MADLAVSQPDLLAAATGLQGLLGELLDASDAVRGSDPGVTGAPELEFALGAFLQNWLSGIEGLHGHLTLIEQRVIEAAESYIEQDVNVAGRLAQIRTVGL